MMNWKLTVAVAIFGAGLQAQEFGDAMKRTFTGNEYKGFQWLSYPLDNYGVGTAYSSAKNEFLCDSFACLGISPAPDPSGALDAWLTLKDTKHNTTYAAQGKGPEASLTAASKKKLLVSAVLPKILQVIGIDSSVDYTSENSVSLEFTNAYMRQLYTKPYLTLATSAADDKYGLRDAYEKRSLTVVAADVVINAFTLAVKPSSALGAKIKATVGDKPTSSFSGSGLNVQLDTSNSATYKIKATSPFIVGIKPLKNPLRTGVGTSGVATDWKAWKETTVPMPPAPR